MKRIKISLLLWMALTIVSLSACVEKKEATEGSLVKGGGEVHPVGANCWGELCVSPASRLTQIVKKHGGKAAGFPLILTYRNSDKKEYVRLIFPHQDEGELEMIEVGSKDICEGLPPKNTIFKVTQTDTGISIGDSEEKVLKVHGSPTRVDLSSPDEYKKYGERVLVYRPDPNDTYRNSFGIEQGKVRYICISTAE